MRWATERIAFSTAIAPIYAQTTDEFAQSAAYIHEVSGGRFQFGIGVAHGPSYVRMGVTPGKPLGDIRAFVAKYRSYENFGGAAADRAGDAAPTHDRAGRRDRRRDGFRERQPLAMAQSLAALPPEKRGDPAFFIGNRIRTCIGGDIGEARAVLRRAMTHYALLPYYRNYWKEAGYTDEMNAVERAVAEGRETDIPRYLTLTAFLADVTLCGTAAQVRDGVEAWREAGIRTPVLVPLSAEGDQFTALREIFEAFA